MYILGSANVGKSTLVNRLIQRDFSLEDAPWKEEKRIKGKVPTGVYPPLRTHTRTHTHAHTHTQHTHTHTHTQAQTHTQIYTSSHLSFCLRIFCAYFARHAVICGAVCWLLFAVCCLLFAVCLLLADVGDVGRWAWWVGWLWWVGAGR